MRLIVIPAAVALVVLAGCAGAAPTAATHAALTGASPYQRQVLHDGDRVHAGGRVVSVPYRPVRFCAPVAVADVGYLPGKEPAPQYCPIGVDLVGANLATLTGRREKNGAIEGQADITGTYRAGTVTVITQRATKPPTSGMILDNPPCPAPKGGWPRGPQGENINLSAASAYEARHPGSIQELAMFRPSLNQVVALVLSTGDPAPIQAALQALFRNRVCVTKSRYTKAQIARTSAALDLTKPFLKSVNATGTGHGLSPTGQPTYEIDLPIVTQAVADLTDRQPAGLVVLDAWLQPDQ